jgi:hypothetical protein
VVPRKVVKMLFLRLFASIYNTLSLNQEAFFALRMSNSDSPHVFTPRGGQKFWKFYNVAPFSYCVVAPKFYIYSRNLYRTAKKVDFCDFSTKFSPKILNFFLKWPYGIFYARNRLSALKNLKNASLTPNQPPSKPDFCNFYNFWANLGSGEAFSRFFNARNRFLA